MQLIRGRCNGFAENIIGSQKKKKITAEDHEITDSSHESTDKLKQMFTTYVT